MTVPTNPAQPEPIDMSLIDPPTEELPEISFDEQFFAARPARLRPSSLRRKSGATGMAVPPFEASGSNHAYIEWLEDQSMLHDAELISRQLAGKHTMWANPYAFPDPRAALSRASVWYTAYPLSHITRSGESFLASIGSPALWDAFKSIGIDAIHTGPVKFAGGIDGWNLTPSVDGHFDRISMTIDPLFGTEDEFRAMTETAARYGGAVIDDIVPGHTGKGPDFRLAELNYRDYPGIYHMIDIPEEAWHLLPDVPEGRDAMNLSPEAEQALADGGYIIGALQRVIFYEPGVKETNWSVTPPIRDYKGTLRRWVYLHYFKEGQPTINWLDPTCAGMRLVMGDALHSLLDLGTGGLRLDANGFLGVERSFEAPAWSEGHPLSLAANQLIGSLVRKVGGFTFQELNLAIDDIQRTGAVGPDLSYDFITRPAAQVAMCTGDTEFLRLVMREAMDIGIDQAALVHALQNHDELTYELVHFAAAHRDDVYELGGVEYTGIALAEHIREVMRDRLTGESAPYNAVFTTNGIASTTASIVAASIGITNLDDITDATARKIQAAHLLLCKFNAWQPGVFALSGWDLVGALPLPREEVRALISGGDTRWIERGAYDLLGTAPTAKKSAAGLPRARSLYGPVPEQLTRDTSFASRLAEVIRVRKKSRIDSATLVDVPVVGHKSVMAMVNELETGSTQITVLNFSGEKIETRIQSEKLPVGRVFDLSTRRRVAVVDELGGFSLELPAFGGVALVIRA
ncbi:maltose alpha-D-glucosyltransferase [Propionibacteriaceae bacterium G1746]